MKNAKHFLTISKAANKIKDELKEKEDRDWTAKWAKVKEDNIKWWRTEGLKVLMKKVEEWAKMGNTTCPHSRRDIPDDVIAYLKKHQFTVRFSYDSVVVEWSE